MEERVQRHRARIIAYGVIFLVAWLLRVAFALWWRAAFDATGGMLWAIVLSGMIAAYNWGNLRGINDMAETAVRHITAQAKRRDDDA